jgi:hypothetical protein
MDHPERIEISNIKKLHLYYKMVELGIAPAFKCSSFVNHGSMRIEVDETLNVFLVCDSCDTKSEVGIKYLDVVNQYIDAFEESLFDISVALSDLEH